jgi:hypothetical protein
MRTDHSAGECRCGKWHTGSALNLELALMKEAMNKLYRPAYAASPLSVLQANPSVVNGVIKYLRRVVEQEDHQFKPSYVGADIPCGHTFAGKVERPCPRCGR